jgi:hypothetical protein
LSAGESKIFKLALDLRLERVGRPQQRKVSFLFSAGEWEILFEFRLKTTGHTPRLVVMTSICQTAGNCLSSALVAFQSLDALLMSGGDPRQVTDEIGVPAQDSVVFLDRLRQALHVRRE